MRQGTSLSVENQTCVPTLSERVGIVDGVIDVTEDVLQGHSSRRNSFVILCGDGTTQHDMARCDPIRR